MCSQNGEIVQLTVNTVIWSAVYVRVRDQIVTTKEFHIAQIFRLSVFSNTEFLHPHINVNSIFHSTHQFHSNSASCNTFQ